MKLPTELLRESMDRASKGEYNSFSALKSAIATAEAEGMVDTAIIEVRGAN